MIPLKYLMVNSVAAYNSTLHDLIINLTPYQL